MRSPALDLLMNWEGGCSKHTFMMNTQLRKSASQSAKAQLLCDVQRARVATLETIAEFEELISRGEPNTAKLTGIRLKLAQGRLAHGSIVQRVAEYLREQNSSAGLTIRNLQPEHVRLLHRTSAHTQKWTLIAVKNDWELYCSETREMLLCWTERVRVEASVLRKVLEES